VGEGGVTTRIKRTLGRLEKKCKCDWRPKGGGGKKALEIYSGKGLQEGNEDSKKRRRRLSVEKIRNLRKLSFRQVRKRKWAQAKREVGKKPRARNRA